MNFQSAVHITQASTSFLAQFPKERRSLQSCVCLFDLPINSEPINRFPLNLRERLLKYNKASKSF